MHREREIRILADAASIAKRAAEEFVEAAAAAVRQRNAFRVVLAGGSTPKALYELLASDPALREQVPWGKTQVFFGDERHVGPSHPDSNFRMASEMMLSKVPLHANQVTRSEEHTSELQSRGHLVCRLLLEKKKK